MPAILPGLGCALLLAAAVDAHTFPAPVAQDFEYFDSVLTTCSFTFSSLGEVIGHVITSGVDVGDWVAPKDSFSDYEIKVHKESGSTVTGTVDAWLGLGTSRSWSVTDSATGGAPASAALTVQIRRASDGVVVFTSTTGGYTLYAERS